MQQTLASNTWDSRQMLAACLGAPTQCHSQAHPCLFLARHLEHNNTAPPPPPFPCAHARTLHLFLPSPCAQTLCQPVLCDLPGLALRLQRPPPQTPSQPTGPPPGRAPSPAQSAAGHLTGMVIHMHNLENPGVAWTPGDEDVRPQKLESRDAMELQTLKGNTCGCCTFNTPLSSRNNIHCRSPPWTLDTHVCVCVCGAQRAAGPVLRLLPRSRRVVKCNRGVRDATRHLQATVAGHSTILVHPPV